MAILVDQATNQHKSNKWGSFWQETLQYERSMGPLPEEHFLPLVPMILSDAAGTFPINTTLGAENVAPRAYGRLSEAAPKALVGT